MKTRYPPKLRKLLKSRRPAKPATPRDWRNLSEKPPRRLDLFWILLGIVLAVALLLKVPDVLAFTSPLTSPLVSPLPTPSYPKPPGLDACPWNAIEGYPIIGYPTCNTLIVMECNLDVDPKYITGCVLEPERYPGTLCNSNPISEIVPPPAPIKPIPTPIKPTPALVSDAVHWGLWADTGCVMWYSPSEGRVVRLECP